MKNILKSFLLVVVIFIVFIAALQPHMIKTESLFNFQFKGTTRASIDSNGYITCNDISKNPFKVYTIGTNKDFATIKSAFDWANANATTPIHFVMGTGNYLVTDSITVNCSYAILLEGSADDMTFINASTGLTGKPVFNVYTTFNCKNFYCNATTLLNYGTLTNENFANIKTASKSHVFENVGIFRFKYGYNIIAGSNLRFTGCGIDSCYRGIIQDVTGASIINMSTCRIARSSVGIYFQKISSGLFDLNNINFSTSTVDTGIYYNGTNYTYSGFPSIRNCRYSGVGSFVKGFDFTIARDKNIYIKSNIGLEDKTPHCYMSLVGSTATQVFTSNTWQKLTFTKTSSYQCKFTVSTDSITYLPSYSSDVIIVLSGKIETTSQPTNINIGIIKNHNTAVIYGQESIYLDQNDRAFSFAPNTYIPDLTSNDVLSIWIYAIGSNETLRITELNMTILAH